jgi:tetratricopeptide (TPR) repeat protein
MTAAVATIIRLFVSIACLAMASRAVAAQAEHAEQPTSGRAAIVEALRSGQNDAALRLVDRELSRASEDPRLWTLKGVALTGLSREQEALAAFHRALQIDARYVPALQAAAQIEYGARHPRAKRTLEQLIAVDPANQVAHGMLGALAFDRRDCRAAVTHFEQSGDAIDTNGAALDQFGHCLYVLGRSADAVQIFERLKTVTHDDPAAVMKLAVVLHASGQSREALALLRPMADQPDADGALLNLVADVHASLDEVAEAIAALRRAIAAAPRDETHYLSLTSLCLEREAYDLALEIASVGVQNVPDSARLYTMRGVVHAQLGHSEEAETDFQRAGQLEPERPVGRVGQSLALQQAGRVEESIALLRDESQRHPKDAATLFLLGKALGAGAASGSPEAREAEQALLRAVAIAPDLAEAHAELGKLYLRLGKPSPAIDHLRSALDVDPSNRQATYQLLRALRQAGRVDETAPVAAKLRRLMEQERIDEVERNRLRLIKVSSTGAP